jgi:hypothetical protein
VWWKTGLLGRELQHGVNALFSAINIDLRTLRGSMSAAAKPKRSGESPQAKGREFNPTRVEHFTLDGKCYEGYLGRHGEKKTRYLLKWFASGGSELVPTTDINIIDPYLTIIIKNKLNDYCLDERLHGRYD